LRIDTTNRTTSVGRSSSANRAGAGVAFVPAGQEAPARVAGSAPMQAMAGLDSLLALQAVDEPLTGRKKAVKRGASLLDLLDDLKADLLLGQVSPQRLDAMVQLLDEARERSNPQLDAVLDDIELRVLVELAKLGRFPAR
jgi:hypothetical protein